jgi:hypothetical protein
MRDVAPERTAEGGRTLEWNEIAGLIDIGPDGSWRPTAFGRTQLLKLARNQDLECSPY